MLAENSIKPSSDLNNIFLGYVIWLWAIKNMNQLKKERIT